MLIDLPDYQSARLPARNGIKMPGHRWKNTCKAVVSGHGVAIRAIAVKHAIEK